MTDLSASLMLAADRQAARIASFHQIRDHGLDIYNPEDTSDQLYLTDTPQVSKALQDITALLDEVLPKQRIRIGRRQETSRGQIRRTHNRNSRVIQACMQISQRDFNGYTVDPDVQAVLEVNNDMRASHLAGAPLHSLLDGRTIHDYYRAYIDQINAKLSTPAMKQWKRNRTVAEKRRFDSIVNALDEAIQLSKCCRLVRVDGCYKQSFRAQVTPSMISRDLDRLIGNMRHNKRQFGPLILAVFKIEYGPSKGYHWHGYFGSYN